MFVTRKLRTSSRKFILFVSKFPVLSRNLLDLNEDVLRRSPIVFLHELRISGFKSYHPIPELCKVERGCVS